MGPVWGLVFGPRLEIYFTSQGNIYLGICFEIFPRAPLIASENWGAICVPGNNELSGHPVLRG